METRGVNKSVHITQWLCVTSNFNNLLTSPQTAMCMYTESLEKLACGMSDKQHKDNSHLVLLRSHFPWFFFLLFLFSLPRLFLPSSSSPLLLQGTMHPISSSLVKHTQCAALIPFYNQDTQQCYRDVTFLMHHLRWLAWNASSQGYVVSCRHAGLFYIKKDLFMHSQYLDFHALLWPMSQSLAQPWEGGRE